MANKIVGKSAIKSVTLWFNFVALVLVVPEVYALIPVPALPYVVAFIAAVNFGLRYFKTDAPISKLY